MPIYTYECDRCHNTTEILQGINDKPLEVCLVCKGKLTKLINLCNFMLRGTGWYKDGYSSQTKEEKKAND